MSRVVILVADGLGIGSSADADAFGDTGANTLFHIFQHMKSEHNHILQISNLAKLGLVKACEQAKNISFDGFANHQVEGAYGHMQELSTGKDTPSGHWEMAGVPVLFEWGYFKDKTNSFPPEFIDELVKRTGVPGILANRHAPGTDVLRWHGEEHIKTGMPICYTSADSVFQVAAHEEHFGLDKLYEFCEIARELLDEYNIGRVIARPFLGDSEDNFKRTGNRRDYSVLPPSPTVLQRNTEAGNKVISIGKISDIYAHQGITEKYKATGLEELIDTTLVQMNTADDKSIIFTNLVNFDQDYGHRRDIKGYAEALEYFDTRITEVLAALRDDDVLFITADHGCDPSWPGTDHTREYVPIIAYKNGMAEVNLGLRDTFADMGQTISDLLNVQSCEYGTSFAGQLK